MIDPRLFATDDYSIIYEKYFADLRHQNRVDADPSGWLDTYSVAERLLQTPSLPKRALTRYFIDVGSELGEYKERICGLISAWNHSGTSCDEVTLCPSCSNASLITMAALKDMGAKCILFETPAYFATIEQAQLLGVPFELIPTYHDSDYSLPVLDSKIESTPMTVVWLTQPRATLGFDQSPEMINQLLRKIGRRGYLVVDEATDQSHPARLGQLAQSADHRLIRLRSFTKGMGLNGLRLAAIIHPIALRSTLTDAIETLGGSLDVHSLFAVADLAETPSTFARMLAAANDQVNALRAIAERLVRGSPITVNRLTNGYIGSMVLDLSSIGHSDRSRRKRLLEWCRHMRTPVILGAGSYVAKAPPTETIRLNFFNMRDHITRGISNILGLWKQT